MKKPILIFLIIAVLLILKFLYFYKSKEVLFKDDSNTRDIVYDAMIFNASNGSIPIFSKEGEAEIRRIVRDEIQKEKARS